MTPTDTPAEIEELVKVAERSYACECDVYEDEEHPCGADVGFRGLEVLGFSSPVRASAYAKLLEKMRQLDRATPLLNATEEIVDAGSDEPRSVRWCSCCDNWISPDEPHGEDCARDLIDQALAAHEEAG